MTDDTASAAPIISADRLSRTYEVGGGLLRKAATVHALREASFTLRPGDTLAVVGESGCGKSTLARVVTMIEPPSGGELLIGGAPARPGDPAMRRAVQIVFQNPFGALNPRHKVGDIIAEPLKLNTDMNAETRRAAALETMDRVGLRPEVYDRYPHMFSGGQRQRIAIARALVLQPSVLVLDEPVSALDLSIQAQVLNLLAKLQDEMGLAYLFISHDLSVVRHIAHEVMVMYLGRVFEAGEAARIFATPQHPYTAALLSATPTTDPALRRERIILRGEPPSPLRPPEGCAFHPRCLRATDLCRREAPPLARQAGRLTACHHPMGEDGEAD
jgi:dipeptide transport system ATP-binding protein